MVKKCHTPERMCVICRKRFLKQFLIRYVNKAKDTAWQEDTRQILQGRGIYVCKDLACEQAFTQYGVSKRKRKNTIV